MSTIKLWLIRHGESTMNSGVWTTNPEKAQLTEKGLEQAQKTALLIDEQPDLIISSPLLRAEQTASFIIDGWPTTPTTTWPIQELIYLSPTKLHSLTGDEKKECINAYWEVCDPLYCDGKDAESFATFLQRVYQFHLGILQQEGFIIAVGHGQFFKAYQLGLEHGFQANTDWMRRFRQEEVTNPIKNGEIQKINLNNQALT